MKTARALMAYLFAAASGVCLVGGVAVLSGGRVS